MERDDRPIRVTFKVICESPLSMQEGSTIEEKANNYADMCNEAMDDSMRHWGDHNHFIDVESIEILKMDGETVDEVIEDNVTPDKIAENSKIRSGELDGKPLYICGYSLQGFIEDEKKRKKVKAKFDYIYENCKHWGFFGEGLCFSCNCPEDECPFDKINLDDLTNNSK